MFEGDLTTLSTADLLESAAEHRAEANRAEARLLEHAQIFADRHHPVLCPQRPGRRGWEGRERGVVLGGDGCPEIAEFAPAEFGMMLGISAGAAAAYIGQALALRHRFPHIWAKVQAGTATPWRAGKIATACLDLSEAAARSVDKRLARIVDTVTPHRLENIVKAAKAHADPETARAEAEQKARERGVYVGRSDEHGTKTIYVRAASGDVIRFDATIASIADALKVLGDTTNLRSRRAKAIGIIADPRYTEELLLQARDASSALDATTGDHAGRPSPPVDDEADRDAPHPSSTDLPDPLDAPQSEPVETIWPDPYVDPESGDALAPDAERALNARLAQIKQDAHTTRTTRATQAARDGTGRPGGRLRPGKTELYVHLTDHTLASGNGILRVEGIGPMLADQLTELIGHSPYVVKPVIDLNDAVSVDAYEIPDRIRERVKLTHPVELFPYGTRETHRTMDLDHIQPYDPLGPPGQTNTQNLAPLRRFAHRVKTHGHGWHVQRLTPTTLEWTTPHGFTFHVTPTGTTRAGSHPDCPP
ncbi:DUF222 domain-containing protein [Kribbella sp. NPDC023972]|uniref:DUF222 domain-containing protein n=1 Tax=Kribbella sp. NPDC023972 TaxID=3154795 RepID=UPI00340D1B66